MYDPLVLRDLVNDELEQRRETGFDVEHIARVLDAVGAELAGAYPLRDYIPALDTMPAGFEFTPHWPQTTRGNIHGSARDDDIDYTILNLLLEERGPALTTEAVGEA